MTVLYHLRLCVIGLHGCGMLLLNDWLMTFLGTVYVQCLVFQAFEKVVHITQIF